IASQQNRPQTKSSAAFRELVYGDHPFGRDSDGSIESLDLISVADLHAFHKAHIARDGLVVAVVGDISAEELTVRLDQVFGELPMEGDTVETQPVSNQSAGVEKLIEFDQPQTSLLVVQDSIKRNDPDFFAAYVVNHILGGGSFSSRLYQEIREKRGLTYGVGTSLGGDLKSPLMYAQLQTANDTARQALDILRSEWQLMATEGPTQAEMDKAVKYIVGSYALQFTNTSAIAGNLLGLQIGKRPKSYINDRVAIFKALTLEDLKGAAKRVLDDSKWTLIVTGKPEGF
ncbi:MAG: M16 family metallopeptidase, partial [Alphaproteobacteria bacterium]